MNVLVTGSAGFLGRAVVRELLAQGHAVVGLDKANETQSPLFIQHDLREPLIWKGPRFEACIHLASNVGGFIHNACSDGLEENEIALLENTQKICQQAACDRILYASTINVFESTGSFTPGPIAKKELKTPYARAKASGERFVGGNFNEFVVTRFTNLFGKGQSAPADLPGRAHVIPDLLHKISSQAQLEVLGDGTQERNFLHVSDAARFLSLVLRQPKRGWFNLRSDIHLSIAELTNQLLRWKGLNRNITFRPEFLRYEPKPIERFDLSAAKALGWELQVKSIPDGLNL